HDLRRRHPNHVFSFLANGRLVGGGLGLGLGTARGAEQGEEEGQNEAQGRHFKSPGIQEGGQTLFFSFEKLMQLRKMGSVPVFQSKLTISTQFEPLPVGTLATGRSMPLDSMA